MDESVTIELCSYCNTEQAIDFKFCSNCGQRNSNKLVKENESDELHRENLKSLAVYSILLIVLLLINGFSEESFELMLFWTVCFAFIDLGFAFRQPSVWKLFRFDDLKISRIIYVVLTFICISFVVSYSTDKVNLLLFDEVNSYMPIFEGLEYPLFYAIIIIAVFPALFEELAFRGFVYNNLKIIGGEKSAIWGSSFLFALVHFSIISFIWLIPFAMILCHYRKKYNTIIYGIIAHFTHNTTAVLIEHYRVFELLQSI